MKIVAIIQARMGSTRLPGKVLMDLGGATVLSRVVHRTQRSRLVAQVVVATTTSGSDEVIVSEASKLEVPVFRGSEQDVLDRYWQASLKFHADVIVRITSDCPLIDPELIDQTIQTLLQEGADYGSNGLPPRFPRGLDAEVFTATALERAQQQAHKPYEREHVTPYFYENPEFFRLACINNSTNQGHHRWTLDTAEDLRFLRSIYSHFSPRDSFSWREVLALVELQPSLSAINGHVRQKELQEE